MLSDHYRLHLSIHNILAVFVRQFFSTFVIKNGELLQIFNNGRCEESYTEYNYLLSCMDNN